MRIICKRKDFYDHKCYEYGYDPFPTFDRRVHDFQLDQKRVLTNEKLVHLAMGCQYVEKIDNREYFFRLGCGFSLYIFSLSVKSYITKYKDGIIPSYLPKNYSGDAILGYIPDRYNISFVRSLKNTREVCKNVMALARVGTRYSKCDIKTCDISEMWVSGDEIVLPIMKATALSNLIDPQDIYIDLDTYLGSFYNDKDQESEGLTDGDKAVNHGFNKKESFRNIHPRT